MAVIGVAALSTTTFAGGKKRPEPDPIDGKIVVEFKPFNEMRIEMPDQKFFDFGRDFHSRVKTSLIESGKYIIFESAPQDFIPESDFTTTGEHVRGIPEFVWPGSTVPAASIQISVDALGFWMGFRGNRRFYGFTERTQTPFNDGYGSHPNEFPLRTELTETNWFDHTFMVKGITPFQSNTGLDIGDGFKVNAYLAGATIKYSGYESQLDLSVQKHILFSDQNETRKVQVHGTGFSVDLAGSYSQYNAAIRIAHRNAMLEAMQKSITGSIDTLDKSLKDTLLTARIDRKVTLEGKTYYLLGTGHQSQVKTGIRYESLESPDSVLEVLYSNASGSVAQLASGDGMSLNPGLILRQTKGGIPVSNAYARNSYAEDKVELQPNGMLDDYLDIPGLPKFKDLKKYFKTVWEGLFLGYRIWRYFQYDQEYKYLPESPSLLADDEDTSGKEQKMDEESDSDLESLTAPNAWEKQIGFDKAPEMSDHHIPVVAVIDSGIDYNHSFIHGKIWVNPNPEKDPMGWFDRYGWDFVSNDERPFDDNYHGTQVATGVLKIAPKAKVMPLKVFTPAGITHSASIFQAFKYAVDHNADIIVCGWATRVKSDAIEWGVQYAQEHGVLVVAAAGDLGSNLNLVPAYPAVLSKKYSNVITVTGVDLKDRLTQEKNRNANHDPETVTLAAPGRQIRVAEPRNHVRAANSTGIAAGIVAGAIARIRAADRSPTPAYQNVMERLITNADHVPELEPAVRDGLRLKIVE